MHAGFRIRMRTTTTKIPKREIALITQFIQGTTRNQENSTSSFSTSSTVNSKSKNRKLQEKPSGGDDIPDETKEVIVNVVSALETVSCREWDRTSSGGLQVTQLEDNEHGEACEVSLPGGYSVQIRKLLATHWDLLDD